MSQRASRVSRRCSRISKIKLTFHSLNTSFTHPNTILASPLIQFLWPEPSGEFGRRVHGFLNESVGALLVIGATRRRLGTVAHCQSRRTQRLIVMFIYETFLAFMVKEFDDLGEQGEDYIEIETRQTQRYAQWSISISNPPKNPAPGPFPVLIGQDHFSFMDLNFFLYRVKQETYQYPYAFDAFTTLGWRDVSSGQTWGGNVHKRYRLVERE